MFPEPLRNYVSEETLLNEVRIEGMVTQGNKEGKRS